MASITIRNLDNDLKRRLRIRSAERGHSMEEEARDILRVALAREDSTVVNLAEAIRRRFEMIEDTDILVPVREPMREPPDMAS